MYNAWYKAIDKGLFVGIVFLDLSKAFNSVHHDILLSKLSCYGVSPSAVNWLASYLENWSQSTVIGGIKSTPLLSSIGVPQGSFLGPTLVLGHIVND